MEEDNTIPMNPTVPQLVQMAHDSYKNVQNCAQLVMNQTPEAERNNVGMAMHTVQQRMMEGLFWFEQAASLALPQGEA